MFRVDALSNSVQRMIGSPSTSKDEMLSMFKAVAGDQLDEHTQNFLRLLIENDRVELLPDIAALFEIMKADA